jgi:MFS family permease
MLIGVGESIMTPTAMSILADRFPAARLGFASGFYYMGVPIGVGMSLLIVGYLGPAIGWRNCFYLLGGIGLVLALIMLFMKDTPRKPLQRFAVEAQRESPQAAGGGGEETLERPLAASRSGVPPVAAPRQSFGNILRTLGRSLRVCPALGLTLGGGIALHFILGAATFDQLWFVQERGFERAEIAVLTGWIAMFAGLLGNLFGGVGSDWFLRRTGMGRPMFLFWIMLVLAPFNIAYRLVDPASFWFWAGVFVGYFQLGCFYGPTFSTVQELVPPQIRATVVALYILLLNLVGLGFGITLGGVAIDALAASGVAEPYTWTLLIFTLLSLLAIPLFFLAGRRFQSDRQRIFRAFA